MSTVTKESFFTRLYSGTGAFDVVGRHKTWYVAFGLLVLVCILSIAIRGFNLGIDFTGGSQLQMPAAGANGTITSQQAEEVYQSSLNMDPASVQSAGSGAAATIVIRSETLNLAQLATLKDALFTELQPLNAQGQPSEDVISDSAVSGTWGGEITRQAIIALVVFLVLVTIFLAVYFERSMAVAALIALVHDVVVTAGIYSLVGFEVTPSTVIGLLTILGFSLYDTVVVFDKVKENSRGLLSLTRRTYPEVANLAVNQTLMRSINTSLIAVLPVIGLLVVGVGLLGVGTLADLALVQLVGIIAGSLSSLLLATPILVDLKMRDPKYRKHAERVAARRARSAAAADGPTQEIDLDTADGDVLAREVRRERAMAASASAPQRTRSGRPQGKAGQGRAGQGGAGQGRGQAGAGRPTGKKRR